MIVPDNAVDREFVRGIIGEQASLAGELVAQYGLRAQFDIKLSTEEGVQCAVAGLVTAIRHMIDGLPQVPHDKEEWFIETMRMARLNYAEDKAWEGNDEQS